ncbi:RNA-dependent RNA polymerase 1 [Cytospora mali]|uniref:RNA-dependent RNA polymerase n=1 Tax=Cytospora mali TaxID=578113 RepID=A0A194VF70_CYTMA|nr:RNA-dependent RNA polymerase 1 [Valsa mali var. pyri (nom. inval.)]
MEVHTLGWPEHLSEDALKKQLEPVMAKLKIPSQSFACNKPRNKNWANITFLHAVNGQSFLNKHGEESIAKPVMGYGGTNRPQRKARLQMFGVDIFCCLSKEPGGRNAPAKKPDPIILKGLRHATEQRANPTYRVQPEGKPEVFDLNSLSCGHTAFIGEELVYLPEVEFQDVGIAKFTKRTLLIKLQSKRVIKIPLETVVGIVYSFQQTLTLILTEQPSFFEEIDEMELLLRQLQIGGYSRQIEPTRTRLCSLDDQHSKVIGQCLVYQLQVSGGHDLQRGIWSLKDHDMLPFIRYDLMTQRTAPLQLGYSRHAMDALMLELFAYTQGNHLPFGILFQLQALAWNAYFHPGIVLALARELRRVAGLRRVTNQRPISVEALKKLKDTPWPMPYEDPSLFEVQAIVQFLIETEEKMGSGESFRQGLISPTQNLALIHRVTVTPTRITLHGPELEANNRVLRKFPHHHEYFIRVQFCDESGEDLYFNPRINDERVYNRFKRIFREGVQIAGRHYSFLGWSHSSLRSHSAWFSAPFVDDDGNPQTYFNIIGSLGSFSHIRSPARCAARIGQAFSETPFFLPLDELDITVLEIPDVTKEDRVFSDGVGTLSWAVALQIWDIISQRKAAPTAFQIRFRGSKGMLALDSTLSGSVINIRPSMKKFESNDIPNLEICDMAAKPIPLVLNRQMIKIMEDMGCSHEWFFRMQNEEIARLRAITSDAYSVAEFLKQQSVGEGIRLHRLFVQFENLGIDYRKDDFLRSIVEAMILRELRLLKHKSRIPVRQGVTLFGIMDETGFLKENEVYVTYDTMGSRFEPPPESGRPLLVTRSPALHPGDIQMACNAIPPDGHPLRDHYNVIVFSRNGKRDLPSQLSGGDLDGDIYNIIWDKGARPQKTFEAADYTRVDPIDLGRDVTRDDMAEFFVDFMKLDHLGPIATRHMILADQKEEGILHIDCLKLAELHSTAVDFSKTGREVSLKDLPRANKRRPDFLAPGTETRLVDKSTIELDDYIVETAVDEEEDQYSSPKYEYYRSEKLLGQLYRAVNEQKIWYEHVKSKVRPQGHLFWEESINKLLPRYEAVVDNPRGWVDHLETGREIRSWYEVAVSEAMAKFSGHPTKSLTELETFIGSIINKSGVQNHRQRDSSIKLKAEFDRISTWITGQMRRVRPDSEPTGYQTRFDNLHLCLACLHAGCEEMRGQRRSRQKDMQSFKVVAACALLAELGVFENGRRGGGFTFELA